MSLSIVLSIPPLSLALSLSLSLSLAPSLSLAHFLPFRWKEKLGRQNFLKTFLALQICCYVTPILVSDPAPYTLHPEPNTLNPGPWTLNPEP